MPEAEVIITRFEADISELERGIAKAGASLKKYEAYTDGAAASGNQLNASVGNLTTKTMALEGAQRRVTGSIKEQGGALEGVASSMRGVASEQVRGASLVVGKVGEIAMEEGRVEVAARGVTKEITKLPPILEQATVAAKGQAAASLSSARATGQNAQQTGLLGRALGGLKGSWNSAKQGASDFGNTVRSSFSDAIAKFKAGGGAVEGLKNGLVQAASSVGGLSGGFLGILGPIGIAAGAVAAFIANFSRLDAVSTALNGVSIQVGIIGDRLANFDFSGLTPAGLQRDAILAQGLANGLDAIEEAQLGVNKANADAGVQLAGLNNKLRDRTNSEEERLAIADKITKIETERSTREIALIKEKVGLQIVTNALQQETLGEVSDANKAALNALQVQQANAEASSLALTENVERRKNTIAEVGAAKRAAAALKAAEVAKKAEEDAAKAAEQRIDQERRITEITTTLEDQQLRVGLSVRDQQAFDIDKKYDDLVAKATESFAKLRVLAGEGTPGADTSALASIKEKEAQVVAQVNAARDADQRIATSKSVEEEILLRTEGNKRINETINSANTQQLDSLRQRINSGEALTASDQERFLQLVADTNAAEIAAAQEKYAKLLEDNAKFNSDSLGLTQEGKDQEAELIAQKNAAITASNLEAESARNAQTYANMVEQTQILSDSADAGVALLVQAAAEGQLESEKFAKQFILLMLDTLEKIVLMNTVGAATGAIAGNAAAGPAGVAKGILEAALVTALIKSMFAAIKGQIQGAYTGEDYVSGTPTWSGRDGHLRRLHSGERVVTAETNARHFELFQAAEGGTLQNYLDQSYVLPAVNAYLDSDDGRRMTTSVMVPKYHDANVVRGLKAGRDEARRTNELLLALLNKETPIQTQSRRSWS